MCIRDRSRIGHIDLEKSQNRTFPRVKHNSKLSEDCGEQEWKIDDASIPRAEFEHRLSPGSFDFKECSVLESILQIAERVIDHLKT